ncbi:hypothetical protein I302_106153 [Kwoniella bestiolae CBS 10118]|uniref:Uncharacterized protein n=1 Tax=Kwoniella bestiolae CBS 10118 TaxID=1296100 RepID=A0A1B9G379_9TREE|nr:hypothetical protein I302_05276 [Kwoniella bestiolae CBS 10118]OCF25456.1 hypothetical protein I302_05276 [Kwoniella bestiolae CBS 10118]
MPQSIDDDFSDIVKISPPSSSANLSSFDSIGENDTQIKHEPLTLSSTTTTSQDGTSDASTQLDIKPIIPSSPTQNKDRKPLNVTFKPVPITPTKKDIKHKVDEGEGHGVVEDTVRRVRQQSDKLQSIAQPYADKTRFFAESKPVLFTFIALWVGFSAIPILIFLGFALAATVFILSTALVFSAVIVLGAVLMAAATIIGTILFGATILTPILFLTTLFATGTLLTLLGLFLIHRLYLHIQLSTSQSPEGYSLQAIGEGLKSWAEETIQRFLSSLPFNKRQEESGWLERSDKLGKVNTSRKWSPVELANGGGSQRATENLNTDLHKANEHDHEDTSSEASSSSSILTPTTSHTGTALSEKIGKGDIKDIPRLDRFPVAEKPKHKVN